MGKATRSSKGLLLQYEQMEKELTEKYNMQKAIAEKLQKELLEAREKNDELRNAMRVLDEQCDKLMVCCGCRLFPLVV